MINKRQSSLHYFPAFFLCCLVLDLAEKDADDITQNVMMVVSIEHFDISLIVHNTRSCRSNCDRQYVRSNQIRASALKPPTLDKQLNGCKNVLSVNKPIDSPDIYKDLNYLFE